MRLMLISIKQVNFVNTNKPYSRTQHLNKTIKLSQNNASNLSQIAPNNNDRCIVIGTDANQFNFTTSKILSVKSRMFSHHNIVNLHVCLLREYKYFSQRECELVQLRLPRIIRFVGLVAGPNTLIK
jgi:hypothetical protein